MKSQNILILMTDEHRFDINGFAGNSTVRTPVMDELARTGIVFDNCYTPSPICVPMRQCFAAGQYPRKCGVERYGEDLPTGYLTFARHFTNNGYITTACGKLHNMGPDTNGGWMRRIGMDHQLANNHIKKAKGADANKLSGYEKTYPPKWSDDKEVRRSGPGKGPHTEVWDEYATCGLELAVNEYFIDSYYDKIRSHQPHMLYLGLNNPHYPYFADEEKFNYYLNRVEPFLNEKAFDHPFLGKCPFMDGPMKVGPDGDVTERDVRRATAAYYANIESCDEKFGRAIKSLEDAGENLDEWIIIVTSDHGEMLNQHAIWEKQKFFEGSARIPMIIRYPEKFAGGRRVTENVNAIDIYATLCELCGIDTPEGLDSRSLVQLMQGDNSSWDNETVSQFAAKNCMIKRDSLKYQWYGPDMPEVLFDLESDPGETVNKINEPAYRKNVESFRNRLKELEF